ncbi:hypothetical protein RRG08_049847 [Elysia crispata]|uniref:Uncharacterized protein n=1 Tax=Elysia crispata TaxID=231223 RepID=A0AAE0ZUP2_9GAST|nr:hypothetical protein RRG08_049847 [Elysia crispata]
MHHASKPDLLECLESLVLQPESIPKVDVRIIDGAAFVHMLDPNNSSIPIRTFRDYSQLVFLPCMKRSLQGAVPVDIVWDIYKEKSLKTQTRQDCGSVNVPGLFCTQENADTRLLFHASYSFHHGFSKVMIHATDTDVVIIAVSVSDNIPPTLHALEQHAKWAVYQAGHLWGQSLVGNPELPSQQMWGWQRETMILHGLRTGPLFQRQPMHVRNY